MYNRQNYYYHIDQNHKFLNICIEVRSDCHGEYKLSVYMNQEPIFFRDGRKIESGERSFTDIDIPIEGRNGRIHLVLESNVRYYHVVRLNSDMTIEYDERGIPGIVSYKFIN